MPTCCARPSLRHTCALPSTNGHTYCDREASSGRAPEALDENARMCEISKVSKEHPMTGNGDQSHLQSDTGSAAALQSVGVDHNFGETHMLGSVQRLSEDEDLSFAGVRRSQLRSRVPVRSMSRNDFFCSLACGSSAFERIGRQWYIVDGRYHSLRFCKLPRLLFSFCPVVASSADIAPNDRAYFFPWGC